METRPILILFLFLVVVLCSFLYTHFEEKRKQDKIDKKVKHITMTLTQKRLMLAKQRARRKKWLLQRK